MSSKSTSADCKTINQHTSRSYERRLQAQCLEANFFKFFNRSGDTGNKNRRPVWGAEANNSNRELRMRGFLVESLRLLYTFEPKELFGTKCRLSACGDREHQGGLELDTSLVESELRILLKG